MGVLTWLLGSTVALLVCRFIPLGRPDGRLPEILFGLAFGLLGGLAATRLDFGGWNTADLRAALFCVVTTLGGVAIARFVAALRARRTTVAS